MPGACCFPEDGTHSGMARTRDEKAWLFLAPRGCSKFSIFWRDPVQADPTCHPPAYDGGVHRHTLQSGRQGGGLPFNVLRIKQDSSSKF